MADMDASEHKHVALGLVFLKYISNVFNTVYEKLKADEYTDRADDLVGLKEYIQDTDWHHETRFVHEDAFFKKKAVLHNF